MAGPTDLRTGTDPGARSARSGAGRVVSAQTVTPSPWKEFPMKVLLPAQRSISKRNRRRCTQVERLEDRLQPSVLTGAGLAHEALVATHPARAAVAVGHHHSQVHHAPKNHGHGHQGGKVTIRTAGTGIVTTDIGTNDIAYGAA